MEKLEAENKVQRCIYRLEFLEDCFLAKDHDISEEGYNGLCFIIRDIIDELEKVQGSIIPEKIERVSKVGKEAA